MIVVNSRFLAQALTGVQRYAIELSVRLKEIYGNDIVFVCPKNIKHKEIAELIDAQIVGKSKGYFWEQVELPLYLKRKGSPLLLNLTNLAPWLYKNKMYSLLDTSFADNKEWFNWKYTLVYNFLVPRLLKSSKRIVTISNFSKEKILEHYSFVDEDKISVIYCGFKKLKEAHTSFDRKEEYLLTVSSLDPRKNLESLVKAFNEYSTTHGNISLYIVGGKNRVFSELNLPVNDRIKLLGRVSDKELFSLYKNAKLFTSLSLYEGFGLPILEAMSHGIPTLISDIPVYKELFEEGSFFVDPLDTVSIINGIEKSLKDNLLREKSINSGYKICEKYTWDNSVKLLVNAINNVKENK